MIKDKNEQRKIKERWKRKKERRGKKKEKEKIATYEGTWLQIDSYIKKTKNVKKKDW